MMDVKPLNQWILPTTLSEQQALYQLENTCGAFLQNLSEEARYSLIIEIAKQLPHQSNLHPQIKQSIKDLSIENLVNLLAAIQDSLV